MRSNKKNKVIFSFIILFFVLFLYLYMIQPKIPKVTYKSINNHNYDNIPEFDDNNIYIYNEENDNYNDIEDDIFSEFFQSNAVSKSHHIFSYGDIYSSREYQIRLSPSKFKNKRRSDVVKEYVNSINEFAGESLLTHDKSEENIRKERILLKPVCPKAEFARERKYVVGPKKGDTSIDIKYRTNILTKEDNLDDILYKLNISPLHPNDFYANTTLQKIEQDFHPCKSRLSRETRIWVNEIIEGNKDNNWLLQECRDIVHFFPYAFDDLLPFTEKELNKKVIPKNTLISTTWSLAHFTEISDCMMKTEFTIDYGSVPDAIDELGEIVGNHSEFSIRIFNNPIKDISTFSNECINAVESIYVQLVNKYGSYEELPCEKNDDIKQQTMIFPIDLEGLGY
eukprot:TRINITY_DN2708_c4_g1_i2.p1 TRINITY_DN2708_c4_g1~~TRINITY_DN2708_c4_g1_i2.p1  ORF type:complete len:396 (-),score=98.72 TRINITY_DN2708_c4_g1_i2:237-1424(-)